MYTKMDTKMYTKMDTKMYTNMYTKMYTRGKQCYKSVTKQVKYLSKWLKYDIL